jgi:hypothetical protein
MLTSAHNAERLGTIHRCPQCGSARIRPSRPHAVDPLLYALRLNPFRCTQCLRRFYRFRNSGSRRAVLVALFLAPLLVLAVWFAELYALQRTRALAAPEPVKPAIVEKKSVDDILKAQQPANTR